MRPVDGGRPEGGGERGGANRQAREPVVEELLDFLSLEFHAACLPFEISSEDIGDPIDELLLEPTDLLGGVLAARRGQAALGVRPAGEVDDLDEPIRCAEVVQELVTQALSLVGSGNEAGDVDQLDRHPPRAVDALGVPRGARAPALHVRARGPDGGHTSVRFDRRERVGCHRHVEQRQRVEEGRLPDVRFADEPDFDGSPPSDRIVRGGLGHAESRVRRERHRKEKVAQAVGPLQELRTDRLGAVQSPELSLGPSRHGPCDMELGGYGRPTRQNEGAELGVSGVEPVDLPLELSDVPGLDHVGGELRAMRNRQLGLGDEQLMLEATHHLAELVERRREPGLETAEVSAQLVDGTVSVDPQRFLGYARTMCETGRAVVTGTGIETRDDLASGRHGSWSSGELRPWTGQYEMCSTSLCLAS